MAGGESGERRRARGKVCFSGQRGQCEARELRPRPRCGLLSFLNPHSTAAAEAEAEEEAEAAAEAAAEEEELLLGCI